VRPRTVRAKFRTLNTPLAAQKGLSALRGGLIEKNPYAGVDLPTVDPRRVAVWEVGETEQIFACLDPWWRPLAALAVQSGLRWGELLGLEVSDFSEDFTEITVQRTIIEVSKAALGGERMQVKPAYRWQVTSP
jgi:integrase